jgi:elongation factor G
MKTYPSARIRNVALIGHGAAGKTTLAEAMLTVSGALARPGRVEDGTAVLDFEPEEVKRHISASLAWAPVEWSEHKLNVLDTPGWADFAGEQVAALSVADIAVVVVSAVDGVEAQTLATWRLAASFGLPRLVFVNKLDRDRADFSRVLAELQQRFGAGIAPLELPIQEGDCLVGVADLLADEAVFSRNGRSERGPIPESLAALEHEVREHLVEGIVVGDDAMMERYLEGDTPSPAELEATLAKGVFSGTVFPVLCGSATQMVGVDRLMTFLTELAPSPLERPGALVRAGGELVEVPCRADGEPLAQAFKTIADPYVGRITLLRVLSGTLRPESVLVNPRAHAEERLHGLFALRGREHETVAEAQAGDLVAVAKLTSTSTGDTLAPKSSPVQAIAPPMPEPVVHIAVRPKAKGDDDKLMTALHRLLDEDPTLVVRRDDETRQTILSGLGETHLAVALERMARKFGVEVETEDVIVPYRETITQRAEAEGKYKKQTGGHGQYGVAVVRFEPLERGQGFVFHDEVVGGAIPKQYIPAVEKGIVEAMANGGVFGYPVVDVAATCVDGKHHPVDSSEMSFKMAGALAFKEALAHAGPILLEPVSRVEVTVPSELQGDVLGDLNARRGRVVGTEASPEGGEQTISALVPTAELAHYAADLRSMTGGLGRFRAQHDHYDVAPPQVASKVARTPRPVEAVG